MMVGWATDEHCFRIPLVLAAEKENFIIGSIGSLNDVQSIAELIMDKFHLDRSCRNNASLK